MRGLKKAKQSNLPAKDSQNKIQHEERSYDDNRYEVQTVESSTQGVVSLSTQQRRGKQRIAFYLLTVITLNYKSQLLLTPVCNFQEKRSRTRYTIKLF